MFYIIENWRLKWSWTVHRVEEWCETIEIDFTVDQLEKLRNWCLYQNSTIIETDTHRSYRIGIIAPRMREIKCEIRSYWWNVWDLDHTQLDSVDSSKITELENEWSDLNTELAWYNQTLVESVIASIFG